MQIAHPSEGTDGNVVSGQASHTVTMPPSIFSQYFSIEASASQINKDPSFLDSLAKGTEVYIPALANNNLQDNVKCCEQIIARNLIPVPHVVARRTPDANSLSDALNQYVDVGVEQILLLAGDSTNPAGIYNDSLSIIGDAIMLASGISKVGFAGHPQGHPHASKQELLAAIKTKQQWATDTDRQSWLVTQFVFDDTDAINWEQDLIKSGVTMPVRLGLPGPSAITTLIKFAIACGVGASAKMLMQRRDSLKLLGRWSPNAIADSMSELTDNRTDGLFSGIHVYPFGGTAVATNWIQERQSKRSAFG